jgi:hypothetical protein
VLVPFVRLVNCSAAIVDSTFFQGNPTKPRSAVEYDNCKWARFTNNVATNMENQTVLFGDQCEDCVEFGNRELEFAIPRIVIHTGAKRIVGLSRRAVGLPRHADTSTLPTGTQVQAGSLAWVDQGSLLKVWDGSSWRNISYS